MRIKKITIENYLSLKKIDLSFEELTIFVGKNGSGKSSIMEALYRFFMDFSATGGGVPSGLNDYCWFNRDTSKPIKISIELKLNEEEFEEFFSPLPKTVRDYMKQYLGENAFNISISRKITSPQKGWETEYLNWGDIQLIINDKPIELDKLSEILIPKEITENFILYIFTPQEFAGDRLLIDKSKKIAYFSSPQIDSLATRGIIKISKEAIGHDFKQWVDQQGIKLIERPPSQEEVPFLLQPITTDLLNNLLANIANHIKGRFKFIPAARDERYTYGIRNPIVETSLLNSQRNLAMSTARSDEFKWNTFREWVEKFLTKRVEPNPSQLLIIEEDLRLPIQFLGGGEQEVFALMWHLLDKDFIYGIEEPENHFHPEYLRKLFNFFKEISKDRQIILSTHSHLIIDKIDITNNWIVRKDKKETKVQKIEKRENLKLILAELGVVPSDIYLKDFILFVEGGTEKEAIIPIFAEKLGFKNFEDHVAVISIGGEKQLKNYLHIWLELLNYAPLEYLILLDKHSKGLVTDLIKEFNIHPEKFIILEKGSIEDYYPTELIVKALKELFGIDINESKISVLNRNKEIEKILKEQNKLRRRWKIDIGEYIAIEMQENQIPEEIKLTFNKIKENLNLE
jgi:AAA15 family ATPase/GTPase